LGRSLTKKIKLLLSGLINHHKKQELWVMQSLL